MKRPETYDVYQLLKSESANWEDFARVKENDRQQLRKLIILSSEEDILEKVLIKWIQSETSEVMWKYILNVLKNLEYTDLLQIVQMYLCRKDVIKRYCKKPDFKFTGERLMKIMFIYYSILDSLH